MTRKYDGIGFMVMFPFFFFFCIRVLLGQYIHIGAYNENVESATTKRTYHKLGAFCTSNLMCPTSVLVASLFASPLLSN